jgi:phosphoribosylamine-glycine ligase
VVSLKATIYFIFLSNIRGKRKKMKILILGSGGREHAIAWKLSQSKKVTAIFTAPGNAGTYQLGVNLNVDPEDFRAVKKAVIDNNIGMSDRKPHW